MYILQRKCCLTWRLSYWLITEFRHENTIYLRSKIDIPAIRTNDHIFVRRGKKQSNLETRQWRMHKNRIQRTQWRKRGYIGNKKASLWLRRRAVKKKHTSGLGRSALIVLPIPVQAISMLSEQHWSSCAAAQLANSSRFVLSPPVFNREGGLSCFFFFFTFTWKIQIVHSVGATLLFSWRCSAKLNIQMGS